MGGEHPKQYLTLTGRTVIEHSLTRLLDHPGIAGAVVAISAADSNWAGLDYRHHKSLQIAIGGRERGDSVLNALRVLEDMANVDDWVLVHDAARPCLRHEDIDQLMRHCWAHPVGGILAIPVKDTLKRAGVAGEIDETIDRTALWHAQTPQMFRLGALRHALEQALAAGAVVTDEASAMERAGQQPLLVEGHADNIKITRPEDLALATFYLATENQGKEKI
jgi:2-C-methyl-D-erythritol 4-phosphate cytidylyltransferase